MALQCDPPQPGFIGDREAEPKPDIGGEYEAWAEWQREKERESGQCDSIRNRPHREFINMKLELRLI